MFPRRISGPLGFAASLVEEWFGVKNLIRITIMAKVKYFTKEKMR